MRIRTITRASDESGVALIITLFLLAAISALASSLMFLSQTETYSTMNYTMMTQARYAGEAGVEKTVNYLLNTYATHMPGSAGDATSNYDMTTSPVTCVVTGCTVHTGTCSYTPGSGTAPSGACIVLSAMSGVSSNYPVSTTSDEFAAAGTGTLSTGSSPIGYSAYAVLMSMQALSSGSVVQTWSIVSDGTITGARTATVQVTSTLETPMVGATGNEYAAFATGDACSSISFSGSASTNSYDSTAFAKTVANDILNHITPPTSPTQSNSSGNVGTNGNLTFSGGAAIWGNLYTPRKGVGKCSNGGGGVAGDAETQSGSAALHGSLIQLAQAWAPPTPTAPNPLPGTATQSFSHNTGCGAIGSCSEPNGSSNPNILHFNGGTSVATATLMGNVSISSDVAFHLGAATGCPCYYTFNTFSISGGASLIVDGGPVIINVAGTGIAAGSTVLSLSGGGVANSTFVASNLQINYGGLAGVTMSGGTYSSAIIDAPNAPAKLSGGSDFYGSVIASTIDDSGGTAIHYDSALNSMFSTQSTGNPLLTAFSWKKY